VIADEVAKSYGANEVFKGVNMTIKRGEKVAFVGKNGAGKSTLVKCIMGEIPFQGKLKIGHNVKIGYFAQNQAQLLDGEITVHDTIDNVAVGDIRKRINDILGAFMFGGAASDKKVKVLSGGEKSRLAMIRLLLEPVNLLILDEPTNHLDMRTKDILKEAIKEFDGTVIVVSHDRDFLDGLVEKVYEFGGGKVKEHLCGIYEFLEKKHIDSLKELERKDEPEPEKAKPEVKAEEEKKEEAKPAKLSYQERKERDRLLRQSDKKVKELEGKINQIETQIKEIEEQLAQGNVTDSEIYKKHGELNKELENTMSLWELQCEELENFKNQLNN
jgi:ATP-binding cassette subfamily F protein 3